MTTAYPNANTDSKLTNIIPVPSLSTLGYITDSANKFDLLLSHAFVADYNQTYLYKGNTISIPKLLETGGSDVVKLAQLVKNAFNIYLSKYYDQIEVKCTVDESNPETPAGGVGFVLDITIIEANVKNNYNRLVNTENGKLKNIIKLNNQG